MLLSIGHRARARVLPAVLALLAGLLPLTDAAAHEIPERVAITILARPDGTRLQLLVRVPLEAMRDVEFPLRADGSLELADVEALLREAAVVWLVPALSVFENATPLAPGTVRALRLAMPSDRSFQRYDSALAHVTGGALDARATVFREQALLDVLLEYAITHVDARFAVEPALGHLGVRTTTVLRFVLPSGAERAFHYAGDPGRIVLDPRWYQAARTFVALGFSHILEGIDHLLFVFCLVIPVRRWRPLVAIVSAFTVAHSITLATAALGFTPQALWFPPLVETLIAASIVYMAIENVLRPAAALERRWPMAFAFGLVHGFGFSFALHESLQFAGAHLVVSLAAFNLGVELGQLVVLAVAVPLLAVVMRRVSRPFGVTIVLSALVAHTAWHWMTDRGADLLAHELSLDAPAAVLGLGALRAALLLAVAVAVAWGLSGFFDRLTRGPDGGGTSRRVPGEDGMPAGHVVGKPHTG